MLFNLKRSSVSAVLILCLAMPATAESWRPYDNGDLYGAFVLSIDGAFVSAPPPFTGDVLSFEASQIGRVEFDGAGLVSGDGVLSFHHPDIPVSVVSKVAFDGHYDVAPDGRVTINLDEFPADASGQPGAQRSNSLTLECYVVRRRLRIQCVLTTLITYQQGPQPRILPVTMSGTLQRQF